MCFSCCFPRHDPAVYPTPSSPLIDQRPSDPFIRGKELLTSHKPEDRQAAIQCFNQAALERNAEAAMELALIYLAPQEGKVVSDEQNRGIYWVNRASEWAAPNSEVKQFAEMVRKMVEENPGCGFVISKEASEN